MIEDMSKNIDASKVDVAQLKSAKDKFEAEKVIFDGNKGKIAHVRAELAQKRAELISLLESGGTLKNSCKQAFDHHETLKSSLDARREQIQQWCNDLKQAKTKHIDCYNQWNALKNLDLDHL